MLYVSEPNFINQKIFGYEYTEDDTPYSSKFRPYLPSNFSSIDQANVGRIASIPPSTFLFYVWFTEKFGVPPRYPSVMVWAAFDVLEKVSYAHVMYMIYSDTA